jgi:hypothetical protein
MSAFADYMASSAAITLEPQRRKERQDLRQERLNYILCVFFALFAPLRLCVFQDAGSLQYQSFSGQSIRNGTVAL